MMRNPLHVVTKHNGAFDAIQVWLESFNDERQLLHMRCWLGWHVSYCACVCSPPFPFIRLSVPLTYLPAWHSHNARYKKRLFNVARNRHLLIPPYFVFFLGIPLHTHCYFSSYFVSPAVIKQKREGEKKTNYAKLTVGENSIFPSLFFPWGSFFFIFRFVFPRPRPIWLSDITVANTQVEKQSMAIS